MKVRIQVIKVYDVDIPDDSEDPIKAAYGLQTTEIEDTGKLIDAMTDYAQVMEDDKSEDDVD
jgi:hypothetical protein